MNREFLDIQARFRKGRGIRDQIASILWIIEKARDFQKNIYFCFIDYAKSFVWITANWGKFLKRWECQITLPASWETCVQVKKQQLELDMEQKTSSEFGKEYVKAVYHYPAYLTYVQSTSCKMPGCMTHKLESRLLEKYQQPQICRWWKWRGNKEPLMRMKQGEKAGLKLNIQKIKIMTSSHIISWQIDREKV